jgi:hypothetical protein
MQNLQFLRPLGPIALCSALGLALLGATGGDAANSADTQFTHQAMQTLLQSVSNADVAESSGDAHIKSLASTIQYDEIAIGNQLGTLAGSTVSTFRRTPPKRRPMPRILRPPKRRNSKR